MDKSIEEYLKILYPNIDSLTEEEQKSFKKDKSFLLKFFNEFNEEYKKFSDYIGNMNQYELISMILQICKESLDEETIIVKYAETMLEMLNRNSYVSNNFDDFMEIMYFEREKEEEVKDIPLDKTPIELQTVFDLTEEFLSQIDDSQELLKEFKKLQSEGKIKIYSPKDEEKRSLYTNGEINYVFDGTVNSAYILVHEFMHHWVEIKVHPSHDREELTIFNEFESIYYENAFIKFMDEKGLLKNGEDPLRASRLQSAYSKDPNNCVLMLLELCQNAKNNKIIDKDSIIAVLRKHMPDITDEGDLWSKGSKLLVDFCKEHVFESETINGAVMYRFNTGLATKTSLDFQNITSVYKLAPFIKHKEDDNIFMEQYECMNNKETPHILFTELTMHSLKTKFTSQEINKANRTQYTNKNIEKIIKE